MNSSIGIATKLQARRSAVRIPGEKRDFSLNQNVPIGSRTPHPAFYLMGTGYLDSLLGIRRPGRQVDHSHPSSAEVKNDGAIPLVPLTPSWGQLYP